jgi:hypothetical protein
MIHLREKALERTRGLEYFKIKHGMTGIPKYACATINDFLDHRQELEVGERVLFPILTYAPSESPHLVLPMNLGNAIPIKLSDSTKKIEVYARVGGYSSIDSILADSIKALQKGDSLYKVVLRNGFRWPKTFSEEGHVDENLYLLDFEVRGPSKRKKAPSKILNDLISELFPQFSQPETIPIPLNISA